MPLLTSIHIVYDVTYDPVGQAYALLLRFVFNLFSRRAR
jgi:hypothetical protein